MTSTKKCFQKYIPSNNQSIPYILNCSTVGFQNVEKNDAYPVLNHPADYNFIKRKGRILNEYQILYISEGKGYFSSKSLDKEIEIGPGDFFILFPGEWHNYYPDKEIGWKEHWIGFKGAGCEEFFDTLGFNKSMPIMSVGIHSMIPKLFEEVFCIASQELSGMQTCISGIIMHILGLVNYLNKNIIYENSPLIDKIKHSQLLIREQCEDNISLQDLASELGLGYTWFRRNFKQYAGVSPGQYLLQQKHLRAKELLINSRLSISEIGFKLGFENMSQFSTFFKKFEGISPSSYRTNNTFSITEKNNL